MNRRALLRSFRLAAQGLALLGAGLPAGCGPSPKPPPVLELTIVGGADQNPDSAGRAAPVAVRIYQLSATAKFEQADVFALKDREAQTLGAESAGSQEILVSPGDKKTVKIDLKPMVSAIGVAVLYRDIDAAQWRATQPAAANGPTKLTATVGKLALTLKPAS
jgi:type VI secretion system protein VasD